MCSLSFIIMPGSLYHIIVFVLFAIKLLLLQLYLCDLIRQNQQTNIVQKLVYCAFNQENVNFSICYMYLSYDPYGPARAFIAKLLRKSPYEGRTRWREQGRKKPSGPARIAYGPHTGIFSIVLQ